MRAPPTAASRPAKDKVGRGGRWGQEWGSAACQQGWTTHSNARCPLLSFALASTAEQCAHLSTCNFLQLHAPGCELPRGPPHRHTPRWSGWPPTAQGGQTPSALPTRGWARRLHRAAAGGVGDRSRQVQQNCSVQMTRLPSGPASECVCHPTAIASFTIAQRQYTKR